MSEVWVQELPTARTFATGDKRDPYLTTWWPDALPSGLDGRAITCTCPAGQHGKPCKHARVVLAEMEREGVAT